MEEKGLLLSINKYRPQIMGFAALWIFIYHEWQPLSAPWTLPYYAERFIKDIGFIGVDIFLLLSGMGMTYAVQKYSLKEFYKRRYRRLLLPILAAGILHIFISRWPLGYFAKCLCGYTFLTGDVTAFLWYVYAIALFYLLFPLYWHFFEKSGNKYLFFAATLAVWYIAVLLLKNVLSDTGWLVMNRVPVFLLGALLGWMAQNGSGKKYRKLILWLSVPMLLAGLALEYTCSVYGMKLLAPMPTVFLPALFVGVSSAFLLAALLEKIGRTGKVLGFFGGISLELYCLQEVMGEYFIPLFSRFLPSIFVNIAFFALVTVSAWGVHKLNEKITSKQ